ncbi:MAG: PspC domain-containing protein [Deltaproteobacteria bacterium]|nr:PspC domain-containing protein [Deltaproteobacteria bacterium]
MSRFRHRKERGPYRSRGGVLLGVCSGLADYFYLNVFWIRVLLVVLFILTGLWPISGLYIVAYLLMKPEPVRPIETKEEQEFYDSYLNSRKWACQRLKRRYENLSRRIQRMEDKVTGREFDWDRKYNAQ